MPLFPKPGPKPPATVRAALPVRPPPPAPLPPLQAKRAAPTPPQFRPRQFAAPFTPAVKLAQLRPGPNLVLQRSKLNPTAGEFKMPAKPTPPQIIDSRVERFKAADPYSFADYLQFVGQISNLPAGYKIIKVTNGWHEGFEHGQMVGHFNIEIDGGPQIHVYQDGYGGFVAVAA